LRDLLALLGASIVLILVTALGVAYFYGQIESPYESTRQLTKYVSRVVFLLVALLVWWAFNKLAAKRGRTSRKK
jgi:uncharacterized protein HemY